MVPVDSDAERFGAGLHPADGSSRKVAVSWGTVHRSRSSPNESRTPRSRKPLAARVDVNRPNLRVAPKSESKYMSPQSFGVVRATILHCRKTAQRLRGQSLGSGHDCRLLLPQKISVQQYQHVSTEEAHPIHPCLSAYFRYCGERLERGTTPQSKSKMVFKKSRPVWRCDFDDDRISYRIRMASTQQIKCEMVNMQGLKLEA
jgi:hypothetical protein